MDDKNYMNGIEEKNQKDTRENMRDCIGFNSLKLQSANPENPKWSQMIARKKELYTANTEIRSDFERDYTRIIYSNAFKRLKHKTQVFFSPSNDHICTRIEHVNYVESISYGIAKMLGLNTELTKTIAIAHDLGHSPFGHAGERVLNSILMQETGNAFWHEKNGLNYVDNIELLDNREGYKENLNLTYAVRDGIISHCGEIEENSLKPRNEAIDLEKYTKPNEYAPYTWEGCVVKISDKISYLGRDIEDALRFKILTEADIQELQKRLNIEITGYDILNTTNIVNYLMLDLIKNTTIEKGLTFLKEGLTFINELKAFNYEKIYKTEKNMLANKYFNLVLSTIFEVLKKSYNQVIKREKNIQNEEVITEFSNWLSNYCVNEIGEEQQKLKNYKIYNINKSEDYSTAIIEYIAGMTDNKAIETYNKIISF